MNPIFKVGIDIGSTTIKLAVLSECDELIYKNYARHFSEIGHALQKTLALLRAVVGSAEFTLALTGSAGLGIAQRLQLPFVQEVIACAQAVRRFIPQTDTVVELGGEDAKITYFDVVPEQRMNGVCSGGTGSFIDHMASLLSTDAQGLNGLAEQGSQIYTIASRCGVFAKTDVQALMNDGASKPDIALSIFQAVVNQTISNLAQGHPISGHVAFLGGPLHFLSALKRRFILTLDLDAEHVIDVQEGLYFVAMGAALAHEARKFTTGDLEECLEKARQAAARETRQADFTLFANKGEYEEFRHRHASARVKKGNLASYEGPVYVGIDAGSTTTKLAVIGRNKEVIYTSYASNQGTPLKVAVSELRELYQVLPPQAYIARVFTTGYGEAMVKAAVHADGSEVETFAHLKAAQEFCPQVTFVLDIGGQDMKCFFVKNGTIGNITLNEACSAGCGSFIQNFAESLHLTTAQFAQKALDSQAPVDLGTRCTVFMNSKVKQAQKEGASTADISAGIALSVIKNALFKVMQLKDVSTLGEHIVVQGGTFYNDAVLRCLEKLLDKNVIRPDIAGLMGAYGAAVLALEADAASTKPTVRSSLLSAEQLSTFSVTSNSYRCNGCGNKCLITCQKFPDGGRYFSGNRCEKGVGGVKHGEQIPNIYRYKYERLFEAYQPLLNDSASRGSLGLVRVLNMYEEYPFWFTLFTKLGYQVVLSGHSTAQMYYKGMATVPSDSLCYPAKLAHGHIVDLLERGVKKIFYPCEPYNMVKDECQSHNHFNCPIVASYAENIRCNMDILQEEKIKFYQPFLPLYDKNRLCERLHEEFGVFEGITRVEVKRAVEAAYKELERYRQDVDNYGREILKRIEQTGEQAIMLVGRPYHIDPEINHGIADMISSYKLPIISEDAVCHADVDISSLQVVNQWSYHARLYKAAKFAAEHSNITLIQLSSFGCGLDAITTGAVRSILESHERVYTMIKLDEVSNLGAARIRLRSLLAVLARRSKPIPRKVAPAPQRPRFTKEFHRHTILLPQMAPTHYELIKAALYRHGYDVLIPPMSTKQSTDLGLRYVNNDMCYPAIVVIGQLLAALKDGLCDPDHTSIMFFQTCGACRATNYISVLREALKNSGFAQVPVFAFRGRPEDTDSFKLTYKIFVDILKAALYGDALMTVRGRTLPYELQAGSTEALYDIWMERLRAEIKVGGWHRFKENIRAIVEDFDELPVQENLWKPKVGVVGEVLVKYHPYANNRIEKILLEEGAEVVMPDLVDFLLYLAYDPLPQHKLLAGSYKDELISRGFISMVEMFRAPLKKALKESHRFKPPITIYQTAELASRHVSLGNMAGEGWFLTGEMVKLIEEQVPNIVCLQPFGCLPNHITGKGVLHELRRRYPGVNITAIDCDAGSSEVNQLNRIKLMLAIAKSQRPAPRNTVLA